MGESTNYWQVSSDYYYMWTNGNGSGGSVYPWKVQSWNLHPVDDSATILVVFLTTKVIMSVAQPTEALSGVNWRSLTLGGKASRVTCALLVWSHPVYYSAWTQL